MRKKELRQFLFCSDCGCDPTGSASMQCQSNGQCQCKEGYSGKKCNIACTEGWTLVENKCFQMSNDMKTYDGAANHCHSIGGLLVEPRTTVETDEVVNFARTQQNKFWAEDRFWIGINDKNQENLFVYESNAKQVGFTRWSQGQPDNSNDEDCVEIWHGNEWNDAQCDIKFPFVCQKSMTGEVSPSPSLKLSCPEGWIEQAGKCYRLPNETTDFHSAAARCQQLGGKLTEPKNKQDNDVLITLVKYHSNKSRFWLGITDENQEGNFVFLSTREPIPFASWADDQPDNGGFFSWSGEDCVELRIEWGEKWNDHGCDEGKHFICERPFQG